MTTKTSAMIRLDVQSELFAVVRSTRVAVTFVELVGAVALSVDACSVVTFSFEIIGGVCAEDPAPS